jgi:hypothetical protein
MAESSLYTEHKTKGYARNVTHTHEQVFLSPSSESFNIHAVGVSFSAHQ